jgi:hypothetical protein
MDPAPGGNCLHRLGARWVDVSEVGPELLLAVGSRPPLFPMRKIADPLSTGIRSNRSQPVHRHSVERLARSDELPSE